MTYNDNKWTKQLFVLNPRASRIELFIRIIYSMLIGIVLSIYGTLAGICLIIQWPLILVVGRRPKCLNNIIKGYLEYYTHIASYIYLTTDKRPGILPSSIAIYEKQMYYEKDTIEVIDDEVLNE